MNILFYYLLNYNYKKFYKMWILYFFSLMCLSHNLDNISKNYWNWLIITYKIYIIFNKFLENIFLLKTNIIFIFIWKQIKWYIIYSKLVGSFLFNFTFVTLYMFIFVYSYIYIFSYILFHILCLLKDIYNM